MKKGIKARLKLPKESFKILYKQRKTVQEHLDCFFLHMDYDIYEAEYNGEDVCIIDVVLMEDTYKIAEELYKCFKQYIKDVVNKQPEQIIKLKFDRL